MDWEQATAYSAAVSFEATVLGKNAWQEQGIADFLRGDYRRAVESHGPRRPPEP